VRRHDQVRVVASLTRELQAADPAVTFRVEGAGCWVLGAGCRVEGAGLRVQGAPVGASLPYILELSG